MPFLDSENIRPLYDVIDGGPPQAFRCKIGECKFVSHCLRGIVYHQLYLHGVKQQSVIEFKELEAKTNLQ